MKLTLQLKLLPNEEQIIALFETMHQFNDAASYAAKVGFDANVFSRPSIQKLCYHEIRSKFNISAQMAIRAISKASEAFSASGKKVCPLFNPEGAMTYDERILSFKNCHRVSLLTISMGRIKIPYVFGNYQTANLNRIRGQCDLIYRNNNFFLICCIEFQESPPIEIKEFIGVDLGIVNIATDSESEIFSGKQIDQNRKRRATARKQYQRKGTKNAKRRLKKMSGRQSRFQKQVNHTISKQLVLKAKTLGKGIAMEDLTSIRKRIEPTVSKRFRRRFGNWSFSHLRKCIEYKTRLHGIPLVFLNPRNSSRTCSQCKHCEKSNRKSQSVFKCKQCGFSENADLNAALNLSAWAVRKSASKVATSGK